MFGFAISEIWLILFVLLVLLKSKKSSQESDSLIKFLIQARKFYQKIRFQITDLHRQSNVFLWEQEQRFQEEEKRDKKSSRESRSD